MNDPVSPKGGKPKLEELQSLAHEQSADSWAKLLDHLTDLYLGAEDQAGSAVSLQFGDIACRLMDDVGVEDRAMFSQRIAALNSVSAELIKRLANDQESVAAPVLEHSPLLTERDLISIIEGMMSGHRVAISKRGDLSTKVTDSLVKTNETEVLREVAGNPKAKFSDHAFRQIAERAKLDVDLQEKVVKRDDLTQSVKVQLSPCLSAEQKELLMGAQSPSTEGPLGVQKPGTEGLLDSLMEIESSLVDQKKKDKIQARMFVTQIAAGERSLNDVMVELAKGEQFFILCLLLADAAKIPEKAVSTLLLAKDPAQLIIVCRAIGANVNALESVTHLRAQRLRMPDGTSSLTEEFKRLSIKEADMALKAIRAEVRSSAAA